MINNLLVEKNSEPWIERLTQGHAEKSNLTQLI